ncbi:CaiB/BaiF CoA transferase family protein [Gryllotalpicola protaetiae]|uniref:CoA transferase n=1 Tax=Gryllotalpicola protaetiae TaxID=2419771 RepID=A0A387BQ94_9MICO|nr:CoA transferase [Gryllotalpicola protaetiae]AYG03146.1 CoA transferase [Gryllotalpicola protaetiae]
MPANDLNGRRGDFAAAPALSGIRVLDFTRFVSGPYTTMLMADAGADVVKVEPIGGEATRFLDPKIETPDGEASGYFHRFNRSKRSLCVDFRSTEGRDLLLRMIPQFDVIVENFRPGVLDALGLGYDVVSEIAPGLIYCSISGFGQTAGPHRSDPAFAILAEVSAGVVGRTNRLDEPPVRLSAPIGDLYPAAMAVAGVSMALFRRERTGEGAHIDVAMFDALVSLNENAITMSATTGREVRPAGRLTYTAPFGIFEAADGYICIAVLGDKVWHRFCEAIGRPELAEASDLDTGTKRAASMDGRLGTALADWLSSRTRQQAVDELLAGGVPAGPVSTPFDIIDSPQAVARELIWDVPSYTGAVVRTPGSPIRIEPGGFATPGRVPAAGEHTRELLESIAGLDDAEIDRLERAGVIASWSPSRQESTV